MSAWCCLAMSLAVWLHGYYNGTGQSAVKCMALPKHSGQRQRFWLPKPDWFSRSLENHQVENSIRSLARIWCLFTASDHRLFVKVGKVWDSSLMPLTDNEEMLCLAFLGYPTDFYPLHSKVVLKLKDPILLSLPGIDLGSVLLSPENGQPPPVYPMSCSSSISASCWALQTEIFHRLQEMVYNSLRRKELYQSRSLYPEILDAWRTQIPPGPMTGELLQSAMPVDEVQRCFHHSRALRNFHDSNVYIYI